MVTMVIGDIKEDCLIFMFIFVFFSEFNKQELFSCAMSRKEGIYRRKKRIMAFDPYTTAMHAALEAKKREVYAALGRYKY